MRSRVAEVVLLFASVTSACSPVLDWREVRLQGTTLTTLFPCRPAGQARRLVLAGADVEMMLHACTGDGVVYGVGFADVLQPARVGPALAELRQAAARNLGAQLGNVLDPAQVPGATPNAQAGRATLSGVLSDGRAVQETIAVFARGTWVYQATVLGASPSAEARESFFGSLRFFE